MSINDQECTEFFDGAKFVPNKPGVYRRRIHTPGRSFFSYRYSHWDGEKWNGLWWTPKEAAKAYAEAPWIQSGYQSLDWCGLLEEHK